MLSRWDYVQSAVIFLASFFFVMEVFELHPVEAIFLVFLIIVAVVHTMDIRDDVLKKVEKRRCERGKA